METSRSWKHRAGNLGLILLSVVLLLVAAPIPSGAQPRVHPDARAIRAYRLTLDNVGRLDQVARALDTHRLAGATRADVALFIGLQGAWVGGEPWRDTTVDDAVRLVDRGDAALRAAIRSAGLSTRDYVLTQMTLMLGHEAIAFKRRRSASSVAADVAPETLAFVEANWAEVNRVMTEFIRRIDAEVQRVGPR